MVKNIRDSIKKLEVTAIFELIWPSLSKKIDKITPQDISTAIDNWDDPWNYITPDIEEKLATLKDRYNTLIRRYINIITPEMMMDILLKERPNIAKAIISHKDGDKWWTEIINNGKKRIMEDLDNKKY
ncbi:MAG: hypothetical protein EF806_05370 [Candidatus Methanoliparum thermophilum]|uniref:Uncharacterized protein n=1 Tax=Methanoliparum thermophilum TaxID=2491083 RepID=A0A520KR48_METT2|nr:hypothetical protein [Candidatus Methanoliparum sp. LAM-1]RZN64051.1 MAG: hypothetical protein EF806_05370 [Candidatus Methanoliparum thermophilum]BDC35694.1 hypothetical protein MTLP_03760 [Candidatus Methanoliparum sp. LAM-1]